MEREKLDVNMSNLVLRVFFTEGVVVVLTYWFVVPNVTEDILISFGTTVSELNDALLDLNIMLLVMGGLMMMVGPKTHMIDLYVWDLF